MGGDTIFCLTFIEGGVIICVLLLLIAAFLIGVMAGSGFNLLPKDKTNIGDT
jgi:hypothetical protein